MNGRRGQGRSEHFRLKGHGSLPCPTFCVLRAIVRVPIRRVDPSRQRRDRCDELARIHRLGEMHLEATPQRFRPIFRSRERGQRGGGEMSNGRVRRFPDARDQLEPVHLRHAEIDDQDVRLHLRDALERGERRAERRHLGARRLEHDAKQRERILFVVDGEHVNPAAGRRGRSRPPAARSADARAASPARPDARSSAAAARGTSRPCPSPALDASTVPPCISTMWRTMARPSPRPPVFRVVPASA